MLKQKILSAQKKFFLAEGLLIIFQKFKSRAPLNYTLPVVRYVSGYFGVKMYLRFFIEPLMSFRQRMINAGIHQRFRSGRYDYFPLSYPLNIAKRFQSLFSDKYQAARKMKITDLKNGLLWLEQGRGIVFTEKKIERESFHEPWYTGSHRVISGYYKGITRLFAYQKVQPVQHDEKLYVVSHWHNYYHWMVETLYRITFLSETIGAATVILPGSLKDEGFVKDTLGAFPKIKVLYLDDKLRFFKIPQLALVSCKGDCEDYSSSILQITRNKILSKLAINGREAGPRYVYISRQLATNRKIANEQEVTGLLQKYDFTILNFEELSFAEQVNIAANADAIVGMHGAGLTNILFSKPGILVLELHRSIMKQGDHLSKVYWKLACALGHRYFFQECPPADADENFYHSSIVVDINLLQANLEMMLNYKS